MGRCEYCSRPTAKNKENVSFHRFPTDVTKSAIWVKNMGRVNWKPKKDSVLCSTHFTKECFDRMTRMRLVKGSVPTVFYPLSTLISMNEEMLQRTRQESDPLYIEFPIRTANQTDCKNNRNDDFGFLRSEQSNAVTSIICTTDANYKTVIHDHHYAATQLPRGRRKMSFSATTLPLVGKSKRVLMQRAKRIKKAANLQKNMNPLGFGCIDGLNIS